MATFDVERTGQVLEGQLIMARRRARERLAARMAMAREEERRRIAYELTEEPLRTMRSVRARLEELDEELRPSRAEAWETLRRDVDEVCRSLERLVAGLAALSATDRVPTS